MSVRKVFWLIPDKPIYYLVIIAIIHVTSENMLDKLMSSDQ